MRPQVAGVTAASQLWLRPALQMAPSGIAQLDALTGGFPRGGLTEIYGPCSSGRTSLLLAALATATAREELCVLVDVSDAFHPASAAEAGLDLGRLLWVRCGEKTSSQVSAHASAQTSAHASAHASARNAASRPAPAREKPLEQMLRVTDLLLQSGGFGMVALDLGDVAPEIARRIPLTSWFRFRRAVEHTSTLLLVIGQQPCARTCASLLFRLQSSGFNRAAEQSLIPESTPSLLTHAQLLHETHIHAELLCSRLERKPAQSAGVTFATHAAWAG
jgi:hypothetical protein